MGIGRLYRENIYGVMGTLAFHILLLIFLIVSRIGTKNEMIEESVIVEFAKEIIELPEEKIEEQQLQQPAENRPAATNTPSAANRTPSQRTATSGERFFDDSYEQEVENARRLSSNVNAQLAKEIPDLSKIKMPEQVTEGIDPDSIKNIIYTGDSNIEYNLENRYHLRLPIPIYLAKGGGTVVVDISVDRQGKVIAATARPNNAVREEDIFLYAEEAARRTVFNNDQSAPASQRGTIRYTFVAQ